MSKRAQIGVFSRNIVVPIQKLGIPEKCVGGHPSSKKCVIVTLYSDSQNKEQDEQYQRRTSRREKKECRGCILGKGVYKRVNLGVFPHK